MNRTDQGQQPVFNVKFMIMMFRLAEYGQQGLSPPVPVPVAGQGLVV